MGDWTENTVDSAGIAIATRDHGGDGPPLILIHGAGLTLSSLEELAADLSADHRVISCDVRGHGLSEDGPFTFEAAVADLRAVIEHFGLSSPTVVGHSLGGMIAAAYGGQHDDLRAAVNLDGHGSGIGVSPDDPAEIDFRDRIRELSAKALAAQSASIPAAAIDAQLAAQHSPDELPEARARLVRALVDQGDGTFRMRVTKETMDGVMESVDTTDLFDLYRECRCPLLIFNAARHNPAALAAQGADPELGEMMATRRQQLGSALEALAAENDHIEIATVDATHNLIAEIPREIARIVRSFLERTAAPAR